MQELGPTMVPIAEPTQAEIRQSWWEHRWSCRLLAALVPLLLSLGLTWMPGVTSASTPWIYPTTTAAAPQAAPAVAAQTISNYDAVVWDQGTTHCYGDGAFGLQSVAKPSLQLLFGKDGNLVLYDEGRVYFQSHTYGRSPPVVRFCLNADGNQVIYTGTRDSRGVWHYTWVWQTGRDSQCPTAAACPQFRIRMSKINANWTVAAEATLSGYGCCWPWYNYGPKYLP